MKYEEFDTRLGMFLQDVAMGTSADLTDRVVAYWDGRRVVYANLREDDSGQIENEFSPADHWSQWRDWFTDWIAEPTFSVRPEIHDWISAANRHEAGA